MEQYKHLKIMSLAVMGLPLTDGLFRVLMLSFVFQLIAVFFLNQKFRLQGLAMMQIKIRIAICANHILQKFKRPSLTFDPSVVHWLPLADAIIKLSQTSSSCSTANQITNRCQSKHHKQSVYALCSLCCFCKNTLPEKLCELPTL